jgi:hypothetical protein
MAEISFNSVLIDLIAHFLLVFDEWRHIPELKVHVLSFFSFAFIQFYFLNIDFEVLIIFANEHEWWLNQTSHKVLRISRHTLDWIWLELDHIEVVIVQQALLLRHLPLSLIGYCFKVQSHLRQVLELEDPEDVVDGIHLWSFNWPILFFEMQNGLVV